MTGIKDDSGRNQRYTLAANRAPSGAGDHMDINYYPTLGFALPMNFLVLALMTRRGKQ